MNFNGTLTQNSKTIFVSPPKSYSATAATAEWINLKLYDKVRFVVVTGAWPGGTAAVTLKQALTDGGSSKAVSFTTMYTGTTDVLTKTAVASDTFNLAAANTKYVVEVSAPMLDVVNGYDWVKIAVASPGSNADFYSIVAEAYGGRYEQAHASPTAV